MIRDSFWTDSYIEKLSPDEKLIFIYLLTNPLANIAGIYEIRSKRVAFETGYDVEVIENVMQRFVRDGKLLRHKDWVCLVNHLKNQALNPSVIEGCRRIINELPSDISEQVTGWVQAGLLNLTLLNSTLPYSTKHNLTQDERESFLKFWDKFPKKVGKGAAEKAWQKMKPDLNVVLVSLEKQKQSEQWRTEKGKYIPHPSTWLNQKRWEDEVDVIQESKFAKYDS